ncbi:MAG TPA: hypothetical protein VMC41_04035 [Candidatus Nanoarchaeia archaeon]|nr:hypothetical protein [Candidatus Nanoarchaeia archaeon]
MSKFIAELFRPRLFYLSFPRDDSKRSSVVVARGRLKKTAQKKLRWWLIVAGYTPRLADSFIKKYVFAERELSRVNVNFDLPEDAKKDTTRQDRLIEELKEKAASLFQEDNEQIAKEATVRIL